MTKESSLGDYRVENFRFPQLHDVLQQFSTSQFAKKNEHEKRDAISRGLYQLILDAPQPLFLFPAIVDFIGHIVKNRCVDYYSFSSFELWLNQFSTLNWEEAYALRCKIVGRVIPRDEYQVYFPIGMGKRYEGTHFVTAHASPDLDTTVASFWGWIDAFGAGVGKGLHIWNVPGGPPQQVEIDFLFKDILGQHVFDSLSKTRSKLTLCSFDLMTQEGMLRKTPQEPTLSLDYEREIDAVVVIDDEGYYLGDWRSFDVESIRQVITSFENCLRWMENHIQASLISFFSTDRVAQKELTSLLDHIWRAKITECEPVKQLTLRELRALQSYLERVLKVPEGLETSFLNLTQVMEELNVASFAPFKKELAILDSTAFFAQGHLIENRAALLSQLKKVFKSLATSFREARQFVERLEVGMSIKKEVFGHTPHSLSYRADLEEVKTKMGDYTYLTVNYPDKEGRQVPVGVIHAPDLQKSYLGTVTLRDFCNREETKIPPFLEVISVVDHHKVALSTSAPLTAIISDAQSSNVAVAELSFTINDRYSTAGMTPKEIDAQLAQANKKDLSTSEMRIYQRLLQKKIAAKTSGSYGVCPKREFIEYLHYLFAILDDTDLLTKVTMKDVECVASLLNRLKTLQLGREVEVVTLDDIEKDASFVKKAASRLLRNFDLYSLYSKIYLAREQAVEQNIQACIEGKESNIFTDTKTQNGCCQVGQTKLFQKNFAYLLERAEALRSVWLKRAADTLKSKPEIDFFLHMISTVASAEELISGDEVVYRHQDEIWLFVPQTESATEHLRLFLNAFQKSPHVAKNAVSVAFFGPHASWLAQIFNETFLPLAQTIHSEKSGPTFAVLKINPGSLNSRKAMISPYLPKLND